MFFQVLVDHTYSTALLAFLVKARQVQLLRTSSPLIRFERHREVALILILLQAVCVDILRELHNRKLGTGETVYTASLAKKMKLPVSELIEHLKLLKLDEWLHGHGNWQSLEIKNHEVLRSLLADYGRPSCS